MEKFLRAKDRVVRSVPMAIPTLPDGVVLPPAPRSREVLKSYFDLESEAGPLHAQSVADVGRRLMADQPIPVYQISTLGLLRQALEAETPQGLNPTSPHGIPAADRSRAWQHLCDLIDQWSALSAEQRSRVVTVLAKLGFWQTIIDLVPEGNGSNLDELRGAYFRCNAQAQLAGAAGETQQAAHAFLKARSVMEAIATTDSLSASVRYGAAAHLVVLHAKGGQALPEMRKWRDLADSIAAGAGGPMEPLHVSVYWRGISFIPYFEGDHGQVREMLALAESLGREALAQADADQRLPATENLHPVMETRGRAAKAAGDLEEAEGFYRGMVALDSLDAKAHVRLGDFLVGEKRIAEARDSYRTSASLGAPYSAYAFAQEARSSIRLGEVEQALGPLVASATIDQRALTPLLLLRDACEGAALSPLRQWALSELAVRMGRS